MCVYVYIAPILFTYLSIVFPTKTCTVVTLNPIEIKNYEKTKNLKYVVK